MEKTFYLDSKVTIWTRSNFTVEGETEEECQRKMIEYVEKNGNQIINEAYEGEDGVSFFDNEVLYETEECMNPEENDGQATIEIMDMDKPLGFQNIWRNGR